MTFSKFMQVDAYFGLEHDQWLWKPTEAQNGDLRSATFDYSKDESQFTSRININAIPFNFKNNDNKLHSCFYWSFDHRELPTIAIPWGLSDWSSAFNTVDITYNADKCNLGPAWKVPQTLITETWRPMCEIDLVHRSNSKSLSLLSIFVVLIWALV